MSGFDVEKSGLKIGSWIYVHVLKIRDLRVSKLCNFDFSLTFENQYINLLNDFESYEAVKYG